LKRLFRVLKSKILIGMVLGLGLGALGFVMTDYTSTDEYCASCHVHPQATETWKRSTHVDNDSGVTVGCIDCHLPPGGLDYYTEKARHGLKDLYGHLFKDPASFDWKEKSRLEYAKDYTYKASCLHCHRNLFPMALSLEGDDAHLYYTQHEEELRCINCHLHVGHFDEEAQSAASFGVLAEAEKELFTEPATVTGFQSFTERIPGSAVSFHMIAVPGGEFTMGSPESEALRDEDEGPARRVKVSSFWMAEVEVTWEAFEAFYRQTAREGRTDTSTFSAGNMEGADAVTGATPPYGNPDQGWGKGNRPAITMTHHAAMTFCRWLSLVTGKPYRLPTEAEWEYACRGGTEGPYFFEGHGDDYSDSGFWNSIFGPDTEGISPYVIYTLNSKGRTHPPDEMKPNPLGLKNMSGNVKEFCLDYYAPSYPSDKMVVDPRGPSEGTEYVIRGGSFKSDAKECRSAARGHTEHEAWLVTDPQNPKSIWWYSDCIDVGFRVVCEYEEKNNDD
jgi:formylglycine-generating enzyme required for sulfatase activity